MSVADVKKSSEQRMQKAVEVLRTDLAKVRTGRAHAGLLDHVQVEYYGSLTAVKDVANITLIDARTLAVKPYEKSMINPVERAIRDSDLGLNPASMGDTIRVPMPALTEERRKELVKVVRGEGEQAKVAIRNVRRDANEQFKKSVKDKTISEDDERRGQEEIQKLTDKFTAEVDKALQQKEAELMQV